MMSNINDELPQTESMPQTAEQVRDQIRTQLVGNTPEARSEMIDVFGVTMQMRQPPLKDVLGTVIDGDMQKQVAYFVINYCYVPNTDVRIFDAMDEPQILKWPFGPDFMRLQNLINDLMGIDVTEEEKNLNDSPLVEQS